MNKFSFFLGLVLIICSSATFAQPVQFRVAFYNVENLFDLEDNPEKLDDDFTPMGKQQWTQERYDTKLDHIGQVINALGFPAVVGACEVENEKVLDDLCKQQRLADHSYEAVSYDSPDQRGIDVGLLYDTDQFDFLLATTIQIAFPSWLEPEEYTSRDILEVQLRHKMSRDTFHFFVNHWPSRRGGEEASEYRRLWVAAHLRYSVAERIFNNPLAKIIIMGDFNDEPSNKSVAQALGTLPVTDQVQLPGLLYNPFQAIDNQVEGSYNYKGNWNVLDQIIYAGLQAPNKWRMEAFGIFRKDWLLYEGKSPNRTYGGSNYYGGYSDHLPVFMDVEKVGE